jgi:hypothetical protein
VLPAGPVRVTEREQVPFAQEPEACTLDVPRGPVEVPERVQALASAMAAIERAPASVDMAMSFFMVAVSLMDEGCRCGSHARRLAAPCQPDIAAEKRLISFCRWNVTVCNNGASGLARRATLFRMRL